MSLKHVVSRIGANLIKRTKGPFTVIVEGNVGSGKSTFLNRFNDYQDVCVLTEPVDKWRNLSGHNLLALMYENPQKWSYTFESYVQLTMFQNHLQSTNCAVKLMERSVFSARYCFTEKLANDQLMAKPSAAVLNQWFEYIKHLVKVDLIVYLRTDPQVAYQRILQRSRPEEQTISIDYIKSLHEVHEDWLYHKTKFECPAPVLILNGNLERSVIEKEYEKWTPHILSGMHL